MIIVIAVLVFSCNKGDQFDQYPCDKERIITSTPGTGVTFGGYSYSSIVFDNGQEWMSENLRTTTFANGDPISNVTNDLEWTQLSTEAWCHYDNNSQYENPYGKLYNWYTVADARNVCPTGWHVPTDEEWSAFINYLDSCADGGRSYPNLAGGKLKSTDTQYWGELSDYTNNETGFSAQPGGTRSGFNGDFINSGVNTKFWSSTEDFNDTTEAFYRRLDYHGPTVVRESAGYKKDGASVRCLKD